MADSDNQIDKPQRGRPKRAELLPDVNVNTGTQRFEILNMQNFGESHSNSIWSFNKRRTAKKTTRESSAGARNSTTRVTAII